MKSLLALAFIVTIVAFSGNAAAEEKALPCRSQLEDSGLPFVG